MEKNVSMNYVQWLYRLCILFLPVMLISGCEWNKPVTVHYIFPVGFRGAAVIALGRTEGLEATSRTGEYQLLFPQSGVLKMRGLGPFQHTFRDDAQFTNGQPIPIDLNVTQFPVDTVVLKCLGTTKDNRIWFFIGTRSERARALRSGQLNAGEYTLITN